MALRALLQALMRRGCRKCPSARSSCRAVCVVQQGLQQCGCVVVVGGRQPAKGRHQQVSHVLAIVPRTDPCKGQEYGWATCSTTTRDSAEDGDVWRGTRRKGSSAMIGVSAATRFNIPRQRPNCGRHRKTLSKANPLYTNKYPHLLSPNSVPSCLKCRRFRAIYSTRIFYLRRWAGHSPTCMP